MNSHVINYYGRPLMVVYDEERHVIWVTGPSIRLQSGEELTFSDSHTSLRHKFGERISEANDSIPLCSGSTQGFRIDANVLVSVRDDGLVFSIGALDGWNSERAKTWPEALQSYERQQR